MPREFGLGTLRLSVGRHTTVSEIDQAVVCIAKRIQELLDVKAAVAAMVARADSENS